jgi:ribosomal protein L33
MGLWKESGSYIQCCECGHIYWIDKEISIDKIYIKSYCSKCNKITKGLNCGEKEEDIYMYYDCVKDSRYYY